MQTDKKKKLQPTTTPAETDAGQRANYPLISKDWENPQNEGLHQLYVSSAVEHLKVLRDAQEELARFSSINLMNAKVHLAQDVRELVEKNPAYRDAAALLFAGISPVNK
jgi:hypothetical protein